MTDKSNWKSTVKANRHRGPGEVATLMASIHNQCRHCNGWESDDHGSVAAHVEACTAKDCHLWELRTGKRPRQGIKPQRFIRQFCVDCQGGLSDEPGGHRECYDAIRDCLSPGCWLYPWRSGQGVDPNIEAECE